MNTEPLVFITGASSGIGQALAARFRRAGYRLALVEFLSIRQHAICAKVGCSDGGPADAWRLSAQVVAI